MTRPHGISGSLTPTFVPARAVALAVRRPFAFALIVRLPTALRAPSRASVTVSEATDRKSTRLNSSHGYISYAVFCLKKKKQQYGVIGSTISYAVAPPLHRS